MCATVHHWVLEGVSVLKALCCDLPSVTRIDKHIWLSFLRSPAGLQMCI